MATQRSAVPWNRQSTPGIVEQYGHSTMAAAEVGCRDCHVVAADYPGAVAHEGVHVLNAPTTAICQGCHANEVAQSNQSRHGLPAFVAYAGEDVLSEENPARFASIPEGGYQPEKVKMRNALRRGHLCRCHGVADRDRAIGD